MAFDYSLVQRIAEPVIGGVLLTLILRVLERRARLVVYFGHVSSFHLPAKGETPAFDINAHSIVIRNGGKLPAHNVRVPHPGSLAAANINVSVDRGISFTQSLSQNGTDEILMPILAPGQQVTISYLYYPPILWNQINLPISCDECMARTLTVIPTRQLSRRQQAFWWSLIVIGAITVIAAAVQAARWAMG
jgi:hypothetical protein